MSGASAWATSSVVFRFGADAIEPGLVQLGPKPSDTASQQFRLLRDGKPVAVVVVVWPNGADQCAGSAGVEPPHRGPRD